MVRPIVPTYSNSGANKAASLETADNRGSAKGTIQMKAGKLGGFTHKTPFGAPATNPGQVGTSKGAGGAGSSKGS